MTIVLDTNVWYAALTARSGLCARLVEVCLSRHSLVLSQHILTELRRHLASKGKLTDAQLDAALAALASPVVQIVIPAAVVATACRDADDLPVLGTALAGGAEIIATGDRDLLDLVTFERVEILTPRALFNRLVSPDESTR